MKARRTYDIGNGECLTVPAMAARTGLTENWIRARLLQGKRGKDLIAPIDRRANSQKAASASRQARKQQPKFIVEPDMSHEEIATALGIGVRYVAKLERQALRKIRERLRISHG